MRLEHQDRESAKERALRIPLDYVHGTDPVQRWKFILTGIVAIITAGYGIWLMLGSHGGLAFSHGPVARAHAAWDADCSACHVNYVPLREDAAQPLVRLGLVANDQTASRAVTSHAQADRKCETCHAGPPHHHNELEADAKSCVHCHTDHRGRNEEIARPSDSHCTRCHQEIFLHRLNNQSTTNPPIEGVSQFSRDRVGGASASHPEFRSLKTDPGNVKFNHALHMTQGIPAPDPRNQGIKLMKWSDLPAEFARQDRESQQLRGAAYDAEFVQLECSSCHRTVDGAFSNAPHTAEVAFELQSAGAYMLPINYSRHCRACHPLNYEPGLEMPHGLTAQAMREFLAGRYLLDHKSGDVATSVIRRRAIPGRSPQEFGESEDEATAKLKVTAAEQYLLHTKACEKCHSFATAKDSSQQSFLRNVEPPNIPAVWLKHAKFDHRAHRDVRCAKCHDQAFPNVEVGSNVGDDRSQPSKPPDQDIVMINGRDTCLECHAERSRENPQGGARFDCVECHRYHAANHH